MRLSHFSAQPLTVVRSARQEWRYGRPTMYEKPKGLWLSVDGPDGWDAWCRREEWGLATLARRYRVELVPDHRVLALKSTAALRRFTRRYGWSLEEYHLLDSRYIRWNIVAQEHQGLIISPYLGMSWSEPDLSWYYGWDCASECVWDAAAVARIVEVKQKRRAA